jgi:hypothetical protein
MSLNGATFVERVTCDGVDDGGGVGDQPARGSSLHQRGNAAARTWALATPRVYVGATDTADNIAAFERE